MKKEHQHLLVFFGAAIGTLILFSLFKLYTVILFPILLFAFAFWFGEKKTR